jgi:hypothetical protein
MTKKPDPIDAFFFKLFRSVKFYVILGAVIVSSLIWASLPSWEEKNSKRINDQIGAINNEVEQAPVQAWRTWEKLQSELQGKTIKSKLLKTKIDELKTRMTEVYPEIQVELERIEAERKKAVEAEMEAEYERNKIKAEQEAREQLRKKYRNISQDAKDAVASLKKLEAYTEVGVNKLKYQEALGVAWGDIKVFVESAEARENYSELSALLTEAIESYKDAANAWDEDYKSLLQTHWQLGAAKIREIDHLVNQ